MAVSRRELLAGMGGAGLAYVFHLGCTGEEPQVVSSARPEDLPPPGAPNNPGVDYRHWLMVGADGTVIAYTSRVEIGQGFKTALVNVLCQGMELPETRVEVVLGDTALCPPDGPTTGSAATQFVVWGFWEACSWVRGDLLRRASHHLGVEEGTLAYRRGEFVDREGVTRLTLGELVEDRFQVTTIDPDVRPDAPPDYSDRRTLNVNGEAIVTGTQVFTGDLYPEGCLYGGRLRSPYHYRLSRLVAADTSRAVSVPGVVAIREAKRGPVVFGETYMSVRKGLAAIDAVWGEPKRPQKLDNEGEIRSGAELIEVLEEKGDVEAELSSAHLVVSESYRTQYASQTPIETDSAVVEMDGDRMTVWTGTQNPVLVRSRVAEQWQVPEEKVRVIGMPVGGAFGAKTGHVAPVSAARMTRGIGAPVKEIHSRSEQINPRSRYKESVIVDIASAVDASGRVTARRIDIFQDEGFGTRKSYAVPNLRTRLFRSPMPLRHGVMRGTSYVQVCYALESHVDMLARALEVDPLEFRRRHVALAEFRPLLQRCGDLAGWRERPRRSDRGEGIALCHHGGRQLGVVAAEVEVDRTSGRIRVERLTGTFDIGRIINHNTLAMGVKGAMLWGLGYALFEEVELDGHRSYTSSFSDYRIPRFSDTPPIEIDFLDNIDLGIPRGCGELPVIPTIGAICNAVYDAIGVRFYELPMSPERVKKALMEA